jgi:hypothetical protein
MADITPIHPICELASRASNGLEVTLLWNRRSNALRVCVADSRAGVCFELVAEQDNALEVFRHPYAFAAACGIAYDDAPAAATDQEQPRQRAA